MTNRFKVVWTRSAESGLTHTQQFLLREWSLKEVKQLNTAVDRTIRIISNYPYIFQGTNQKGVRRAVILRHNSIFYIVDESNKRVVILSFIDSRSASATKDS